MNHSREKHLSIQAVAVLVKARGDRRTFVAIELEIRRAIRRGDLAAYKLNPLRRTSQYAIWPDSAQSWLREVEIR